MHFSFFFFKQKTPYVLRLSLVGSGMCIRDRSLRGPTSSAYVSDCYHCADPQVPPICRLARALKSRSLHFYIRSGRPKALPTRHSTYGRLHAGHGGKKRATQKWPAFPLLFTHKSYTLYGALLVFSGACVIWDCASLGRCAPRYC